MEESKLWRYGLIVLLLAAGFHGALLQTQTICPIRSYSMGPTRQHCYRYVESPQDFFGANRTCEREGGGKLLHIDSAAEDEYVHTQFYVNRGGSEFWIGLNDIDQEGTFRWADGTEPRYTNWSQPPSDSGINANSRDCVIFAANGWRLHSMTCGIAEFPFVCKMNPCQTNDGSFCIGSEPTAMTVAGPDVGLIAGIVVVVLVIIAAIVVVVVLLVMWKFCNDAFYRYVCCCVSGGSRPAMHSLQQENQRLRHELSQNKMSFSGRYSQGQFTRELSGVPDGRGGVLPTIKQPLGTAISPIPEDRAVVFPTSQPPPLALQRSISRTSRVTPFTSPLPPSQSYYTPGVFTPGQRAPLGTQASFPPGRPTRQSAPVQKLTYPPPSVEKNILTGKEVRRGEEKLKKGEEGSGEKASEHDTSSSSSASSVHTPEEKAT